MQKKPSYLLNCCHIEKHFEPAEIEEQPAVNINQPAMIPADQSEGSEPEENEPALDNGEESGQQEDGLGTAKCCQNV